MIWLSKEHFQKKYFYGHPYGCFPMGSNYIYIYSCVTYASMRCIRSSVRKLHHSRELGQLTGVAHNRMHVQALQTSKKKESCLYMYL